MNSFAKALIVVGAGAVLVTESSYGDVLYDNTSSDTGNSLSLSNNETVGNEIILQNTTSSSAFLDGFSFEIYSTESAFIGANVQMDVQLYANDGTPVSGYPSPSTILYDSGFFSLPTPQFISGSDVATIINDLSSDPILVNNDFTFAITITGLDAADSLGLELFGPAPTVGNNYGDYWLNNGTWGLFTNSVPTATGAQFTGTPTPEPSSLYLGAIGLVSLAGISRLRRRQANQA